MKKLLLPFLGIILSLNVISQVNKTNLVVFSEDGDKFYLVINGIRQNMKSETNVKVTDLTTENFSFTIIFEDTKIPSIKKSQALPFGNEYTYRIKDKKGKKAMKYFGETALSAPSNNTGSTTIVYHTTEEVPVTNTISNSGTNNSTVSTNVSGTGTGANTSVNVGTGINESSTTTTTTTTTSTGGTTSGNTGTTGVGINMNVNENSNATGGNVSTGVNAGGVGMNIDINVTENGANINMGGTGLNSNVTTTGNTGNIATTTTNGSSTSGTNVSGTTTTTYSSTTTTTTSTSSTGGTGVSTNMNVGGTGVSTNTNVTGTGMNSNTSTGNTGTSTYTGTSNYACGAAMNSTDFASAKKSIDSKDFEDSKFTVAKQVTKNNCLNTAQIKEIMELFDFEATKLDYAKYAYDFCYDKNNYYKLNDAFDFESSIDDLNEYIEKK